ncbi:hypothetical protein FF38_10582 [Lucilia cuprina]|uniref:Integrase catalytic domain-containing protein n=1 Tax=Lucilia cuprina TaxID=7375 RepID=A0A0L0C750_LUCCU|nr:hypothetical protein FF38_10582 [Lucilia cuprina]
MRKRWICYETLSSPNEEDLKDLYYLLDINARFISKKFSFCPTVRHWTLITDHKPLTQILHPSKSLPVLCISRMANYADFLGNFDFEIIYKPSKENINADYMSRIVPDNSLPVTAEKIANETRKDSVLGKIVAILEKGHSLEKYGYTAPESNYRLSGIARSFVYWPNMDADIEAVAKDCNDCARVANKPKKYTDHHWEYPKGPWERVHIDYAGPFEGMMLLIITDAYSKWLDVKITKSITAEATIALVDEVFANYGVPAMVVSDNGTNFSSEEFNKYLTAVGVRYHKYTAPYHPSTNGQAERSVQTVKNTLKAMCTSKRTLQQNLSVFKAV